MTGLALRSVRARAASFTAAFLSVFLGTALVGSFATLLETSGSVASTEDQETLFTLGAVVGSWGAIIVLFSVASATSVAVARRDTEIALLRTIGTTPRQARRLIRGEVLVVALVSAVLGALVAAVAGRGLLALVRDADLVAQDVSYAGGWPSLSLTVVALVLVSSVAASVAGRRATSGPATFALADSRSGCGRLRWWRVLLALVLLGYATALGVVTITVTADSDDPYAAMATSGSSSLLAGVGLALLSPALLRWSAVVLRPLLGAAGASGWLAGFDVARRAHLLSAVLAPVIVLTAGSVGTLMLVGIDGRTLDRLAPGGLPEADSITLLNNLVTGMIALFAAIMVVNAFAAAVAHRREELARLRLLGATPAQVRRTLTLEAAVVGAVGTAYGLLASLATIVPFALARDEGIVPDGQLWLPPLVVAGAFVLTVLAAGAAARRSPATA